MLIGFFLGLSNGAGVVIARLYGAGREPELRRAVHTALTLAVLLGAAFTALGVIMVPAVLRLMKTPASVWPDAESYLTIYFAGIMGLMLYNIGAAVWQAVGDSRYPFLCLAVCAVTNTVLDLIFVIRLGLGIRGVAYATVLAQFLSMALVLGRLLFTRSCVRLEPRLLGLAREPLRAILRLGLPTALQMAVTAFSNVFIQSYINAFGPDCMSGWTAYNKIDQLVLLPITSLALATTTFVGQNLGKDQWDRARRGTRTAFWLAEGITVLLAAVVCAAAPALVAFFNRRPEVIRDGSLFLRALTPFYVFAVANHILPGAMRGAGNSRAPLVIFMTSYVAARQLYFYIMAHCISNTMLPVSMGYPFGWIICALLSFAYYRRTGLGRGDGSSEKTEKEK